MEKNETAWARGWEDTKRGIADWRFWLFEFFGGGLIAIVWSAQAALLAVSVILVLMWLTVTATAPVRQRNEARRELAKHEGSNSERRLNDEQKAFLCDKIRQSGIRPQNINVLFDNVDPECADFAADIGDAIRMSGIDSNVHDGVFYDKDVRDRGINIVRGKSKTIVTLADTLHQGLVELGFQPERRDAEERDNLFLFVARRPE